MTDARTVGMIGRYATADDLLAAAKAAHSAGFRTIDAFTPFPVPGLAEALGFRAGKIPWISLVAGVVGATSAFAMQWYSAVIDYPYVTGGKPLASWPAFLPVTFEVGVLAAVLAAVFAMLAGNRLPKLYHPAFNAREFARASSDSFFLLIQFGESAEAERDGIERLLHNTQAVSVQELAP